ncbi:MAG: hypothetical protein GYA51_09400 [Candidatus Methanofastidiosa archaeon]|nr:hypothetical protein [Candidatus Methanofastidiosa archaeon]
MKIGEEPEDKLELLDVKDLLDGYLNLNRPFFDELLRNVKIIKKYAIGKGISKVTGPDEKDWTHNPWLLFMAKDNEKEVPFWFLLKREKDLTGYLVAVGPQKYYEYCETSKEADDDIKRTLEYLITYPQKFKLAILIPTFIA